jgi:predicted dehydrogenase
LIVGCGSIGQRHLRNLRSLTDVEVIAFRERGRAGQPLAEAIVSRVVDSFEAGLGLGPDFVLISNPTSLHVPLALQAAQAGVPLFVEKPLSDSRSGVAELVALAAEKRLPCLVAYNLRFHPGLKLVQDLVHEGRLGRVLSLRAEVGQYLPDWHPGEDYRLGYSARRELGGGVVLDLSHELDYVRALLGRVTRVSAMVERVSGLEIDTEDLAEVLLRFESGAVASVHLDYLARSPNRSCRIVGSEGTLEWDYFANEVRLYEARHGEWMRLPYGPYERNQMFRAEMAHFLRCLQGREMPLVDLAEGAATLELALAIQEAGRAGTAAVSIG